MTIINLRSFPRAILHIDGDSFFASCEQAIHPELRGKPIVTGRERGIASAVSVEAKKLGIKRAMTIREIKSICPDVIHVPSDYETYSLFSKRMFEIVRRYTSIVEEYSIDECFADITGLQRPLGANYRSIAAKIKHDLESELGMTFSVGLAPTKVVAKLASKWDKPSGLVVIPGNKLHEFLDKVPVGDVWGIGEKTTAYMRGFGIKTAFDFAKMDEVRVKNAFTKPHQDIWQELRGKMVYEVTVGEKHDYKSISKTKTFTPASSDREFVFSQLSKNIENACIKLRRHKLVTNRIFFFLRTQEYKHAGFEFRLSSKTSLPTDILPHIEKYFDKVFHSGTGYRLTGVVFSDLSEARERQLDLFGSVLRSEGVAKVYDSLDALSKRYGKHTVFIGSSFQAMKGSHKNERGDVAERKESLFRGETKRKRLGIPMLGDVA